MIDTNNLQVGQDQEHAIPATGPIDRNEFRDQFDTVDTPDWKEKAKALAFNEEPVKIVVTEDGRPNAEQTIQLLCNGLSQMIIRGAPIIVKRKFVEILARAKSENISTPQYTDANGNSATKIVKQAGLKYPFRVLEDRNPNGSVWLERVLREQ